MLRIGSIRSLRRLARPATKPTLHRFRKASFPPVSYVRWTSDVSETKSPKDTAAGSFAREEKIRFLGHPDLYSPEIYRKITQTAFSSNESSDLVPLIDQACGCLEKVPTYEQDAEYKLLWVNLLHRRAVIESHDRMFDTAIETAKTAIEWAEAVGDARRVAPLISGLMVLQFFSVFGLLREGGYSSLLADTAQSLFFTAIMDPNTRALKPQFTDAFIFWLLKDLVADRLDRIVALSSRFIDEKHGYNAESTASVELIRSVALIGTGSLEAVSLRLQTRDTIPDSIRAQLQEFIAALQNAIALRGSDESPEHLSRVLTELNRTIQIFHAERQSTVLGATLIKSILSQLDVPKETQTRLSMQQAELYADFGDARSAQWLLNGSKVGRFAWTYSATDAAWLLAQGKLVKMRAMGDPLVNYNFWFYAMAVALVLAIVVWLRYDFLLVEGQKLLHAIRALLGEGGG